jgi:hypothetical protein
MTQESRTLATSLVNTFKQDLSKNVQSEIGESGFEKLAVMINELIQEDRKSVVNMLDELTKELRKDIEIAELGL